MKRSYFVSLALAVPLAFSACASVDNVHDTKVVSMHRNIDKSVPDYNACENFSLTKGQVAEYFAKATQVDGLEFHNRAIIAACSYSGTLLLDGQKANWTIYAAGAGTLYNGKGLDRVYLCEGTCCTVNDALC